MNCLALIIYSYLNIGRAFTTGFEIEAKHQISKDFEEVLLNLSAVYFNMLQYQKAFEMIDQCSVDSQDPKYRSFLKAILSAWIEEQKTKQKDFNKIKKSKCPA